MVCGLELGFEFGHPSFAVIDFFVKILVFQRVAGIVRLLPPTRSCHHRSGNGGATADARRETAAAADELTLLAEEGAAVFAGLFSACILVALPAEASHER